MARLKTEQVSFAKQINRLALASADAWYPQGRCQAVLGYLCVGKSCCTRMASIISPENLSLPVIKAFMASSLPSAIPNQSLSLTVKVTSGFSTPPGIMAQVWFSTFTAHLPASSPLMLHLKVLLRPAAAAGVH